MIPVVVGSRPDSPWLEECVDSIRATTDRTMIVHYDGGHEPWALTTGTARFDRFLFLQDSVRILHKDFWAEIDRLDGPAFLFGRPPMFMGVYDSEDLLPLLPEGPVDKETSIWAEVAWADRLGYPSIWPNVVDGAALRRQVKHGRDNLVLGNELVEKFKGTFR